MPEDIVEVQKRIKFIVHRMENAIANHQFEKARFYSDEERKERDNLRSLREKYHLDEASTGLVGRDDIEEVISSGGTVDEYEIKTHPSESRKGVFISYSHKDRKWLDILLEHLAPHRHSGVEIWTDQEIEPGELWHQRSRIVSRGQGWRCC